MTMPVWSATRPAAAPPDAGSDLAPPHARGGDAPGDYAVVHLVAQEVMKDLIGPQVVDHMAWQHDADGPHRPRRVAIGLLEPVRVAGRRATRERARELRGRAPGVTVALLPYVSRFGVGANAPLVAARVRPLVGGLPVVFHCRNEAAAEWAVALAPRFRRAGIVADIRGPWPEELLFARGFDGPANADAAALRDYHGSLARLHCVLAHAGAVISVSRGMLEWLEGLGVTGRRLVYVPCCVSRTANSADARANIRKRLGLGGRLVFAYLGIMARYQHVEGGVVPFFREVLRQGVDAHLLALTPDTRAVEDIVAHAELPRERVTARRVPQPEVAEYLAAADAGLLLRAPNRLTRVVQPVKLGEYLAAGLPVIVSRGAGRVDEMIDRSDAGIVVDYTGSEMERLPAEVARVCAALLERGPELSAGALALCEREFVWARYTQVVRGAYRRALAWGAGDPGDPATGAPAGRRTALAT